MRSLTEKFAKRIWLWPHDSETLAAEMDRTLQVPGWANVWTKPIQNRIDMLATGVNSEVGVRVLGPDLDDVVLTSEVIAGVVRELSGAADVIADPIRDKNYVDIVVNPERTREYGIDSDEVDYLFETATRGQTFEGTFRDREMLPIRLLIHQSRQMAISGILEIPVPSSGGVHFGFRSSRGRRAVPVASWISIFCRRGCRLHRMFWNGGCYEHDHVSLPKSVRCRRWRLGTIDTARATRYGHRRSSPSFATEASNGSHHYFWTGSNIVEYRGGRRHHSPYGSTRVGWHSHSR